MDYLDKLTKQISSYIFISIVFVFVLIFGIFLFVVNYLDIDIFIAAAIGLFVSLAGAAVIARVATKQVLEPVIALREAILHVSGSISPTTAPDLDKVRIGKELVTSLVLQVYQLASVAGTINTATTKKQTAGVLQSDIILNNIPTPIFIMDKDQVILQANPAALTYINKEKSDVIHQNLNSVLDLSFSTEYTFDTWLEESRSKKATDSHLWNRVRTTIPGTKTQKQFDMAAHYNKSTPDSIETVVTLFDKTTEYAKDDDGIGFIALAVHELRTPLTMLRGYIEVFEDELKDKLNPELADFMKKMHVSAEQLSTFVSNILNVARVEENQLFLQLNEEDWAQTLKNITSDIELRAQVHGKKLVFEVQPDLPPVAVDPVSMYEVVSNLIDNAIKYSDKSQKIIIRTRMTDDGLIETTVQDFGIGMPSSIIGNLFEKFYRNHRSRAQVGGTGLGLYLSKAIVSAHGGQIWVNSKEGEGSTFGFTLLPYAQLADELKTNDNKGIKRVAHGWIKNHSFYRR